MDKLFTLNENGTDLPSHPDRIKVEGVDMTTGSMGQGISVASGLAYGLRARGRPNRVYTIVGDGELNEGQPWEAAQFIAHNNLTNMVVMVDDNKRQLDGWTTDVSGRYDLVAKFAAFGFESERVDGQNANDVAAALRRARGAVARPVCIVLDTTKGAGVDYVTTFPNNHHMRFDDEGQAELKKAIDDLAQRLQKAGVEYA